MLGGVWLKNKPIPGTKPNKPYLLQPFSFRENEKHNGRIQNNIYRLLGVLVPINPSNDSKL
jgi:hypothetical protein